MSATATVTATTTTPKLPTTLSVTLPSRPAAAAPTTNGNTSTTTSTAPPASFFLHTGPNWGAGTYAGSSQGAAHPLLGWLADWNADFDSKAALGRPLSESAFHTADFVLRRGAVRPAPGVESYDKMKGDYKRLDDFHHEVGRVVGYELPAARPGEERRADFEVFGTGFVYCRVPAGKQESGEGEEKEAEPREEKEAEPREEKEAEPREEKEAEPREEKEAEPREEEQLRSPDGRTWDVVMPIAGRFEFVRDPTGHKGYRMRLLELMGDPAPIAALMVKRGLMDWDKVMQLLTTPAL